MMRRLFAALVVAAAMLNAAPARADSALDCYGEDWERRISGCTALIEGGGLNSVELAQAYAARALALSLKARFADAVRDYDKAIGIVPDFAVALNNRAWAYYKWGRGRDGLEDVEKSIALAPASGHSYDTRAHIRQEMGQADAAFADYELAMQFGGNRMVKLYQCGLTEQRLYTGPIDGIWTPVLSEAMETCTRSKTCDPLPADEQCRPGISQHRGGKSKLASILR
jgi:tetratricopeptide (TPR) repeat protein